jgi:hypothetical protein
VESIDHRGMLIPSEVPRLLQANTSQGIAEPLTSVLVGRTTAQLQTLADREQQHHQQDHSNGRTPSQSVGLDGIHPTIAWRRGGVWL